MRTGDEFPYGDDFEWREKVFLGEGSFGKVYKVRSRKDGQFYAIKAMDMESFNKDPILMKALNGEIAITSDVDSEFTVKMITYHIGRHFTYIVLQICDSDLRKELTSHKFTEQQYVKAFDDIINGFRVLVSKGYIHRDIKPANVLFKNGIYKVADFGFACRADILGRKKMVDICGTPIYMAPQLLKNQPYTAKSDIWSLGLMLYEMVYGYTPWPARSLNEYVSNIFNCPLKFPYNSKIGANTKDFIRKSLVIDENLRMSWEAVFQHPLVKNKNIGLESPLIAVNNYVKSILVRVQEDIQRRHINLNEVLGPFLLQSVSKPSFTNLIRQITPAITSHEIGILFNYLDVKQQGWADWAVIEDRLFNVDYRESGDVLSRKLDEIVGILHERNEDPEQVFELIDSNHSGQLDFSEFMKFISFIAPCYTKQEVLHFFQLFDVDKNGLVSKREFVHLISSKMPRKLTRVSNDRARRNLKQLIGFLKWSSVSAETIISLADTNLDHEINLKEFEVLLNERMSFHISEEEVKQLFNLIDSSNNGTINVQELRPLLK